MSKYYGIFFIIVLIAVSGAIAYIGDLVGRRMGRKRLSLFGLRPRHTAIVISVISGMLITIITLGLAMALSEDVRIGLIRAGQLRAETQNLRSEKATLSKVVSSLTERVKEAELKLAQAQTELTQALTATKKDLEREQAKLQEALKRRVRAEEVADRLGKIVLQLQQEEADLRSYSRSRDVLLGYLARERLQAVTFDAGQPLAVFRVEPNASAFATRKRLDEFIAHLDTEVRKAGAKPEQGQKQAVVVRHYEKDPKTQQRVLAATNQTLDGLAASTKEAFRTSPSLRGVVIQAICVRNAYPGEPVYVDFGVFPNVLVFKKGALLAETTLPAGQTDWQIMESLVLLLKGQVRAVSEGKVIPKLDPSQPHAGQSGSVGAMSYRDLFDVVARVQQIHGRAHVTALAKDDTWSIGPLNVELRVEPAGT